MDNALENYTVEKVEVSQNRAWLLPIGSVSFVRWMCGRYVDRFAGNFPGSRTAVTMG